MKIKIKFMGSTKNKREMEREWGKVLQWSNEYRISDKKFFIDDSSKMLLMEFFKCFCYVLTEKN